MTLNTDLFTTKEQIQSWLKEMDIASPYTIDDNLVVHVNGNVYLNRKKLTQFPVQFGVIKGYFDCQENQLTSLKGSPYEVHGTFNCSYNKLSNLAYAPSLVQGNFDCIKNKLISLEGAPERVEGNFDCSHNDLNNLKFLSPIIRDSLKATHNNLTELNGIENCKIRRIIDVSYNKITSLKGLEHVLQHAFNATHNELTDLVGAPSIAHDNFNCSYNKITSLKGAPKTTWGKFDVSHNHLINLEHIPLVIEGEFNASHNLIEHIENVKHCKLIESLDLSYNKISSLSGCIDSLRRTFNVSHNQLTSLVGGPKAIGDDYYCSHNQLSSLNGIAKKLSNLLASCNQINDIQALEGLNLYALDLSSNQLDSLKGIALMEKLNGLHIEQNLFIPITEYIHLSQVECMVFNDPLNNFENCAFYNQKEIQTYMEKINIYIEQEQLDNAIHLNYQNKKNKIKV